MKYKRLLSLTMTAVMICGSAAALPEGVFDNPVGITASAAEVESGQCGENVFWSLDDKGVLTISGTGATYDYNLTTSPFENRNDIKSVIFESGVTTIGLYLFDSNEGSENTSIISVHFSDTVTEIKNGNFSYYLNMESFTVDDNNPNYSSLDGILYNKNQTRIVRVPLKIKNISIPSSVKSIEDSSFSYCKSLTSVTIPDSVTSIGESAFYGCESLTSVTIYSNGIDFESNVFSDCKNLSCLTIQKVSSKSNSVYTLSDIFGHITTLTLGNEITSLADINFLLDSLPDVSTLDVVEDNEYFCAVDGVLYNKDKTVLIRCPKGKTSVDIPETVTTIADEAFMDCTKLEKITIPKSVTSIGMSAFSGCKSLTSVTIPNSVTSIGGSAFSGCKSLTSVIIPNSVTSIGGNAFEGCTSLESITIPDSVMTIGDEAFKDCSKLETINIPKSVVSIGRDAFKGTKWFNDQKESGDTFVIANGILLSVNTTSSIVTIPSSVKIIAGGAFAGCSSVKAVTIPKSVVSIGDSAFVGTSLASVTIPNSVTTIGASAFAGCPIRNVVIPDSVTSIGDNAFENCSSLSVVSIPKNLTKIGNRTFAGCPISSVTIPSTVTSIGDEAFNGTRLTSVTIPSSVKTIGSGAFSSTDLVKATISEGVESIGDKAFTGCPLESVDIPASVTSIGKNVFRCDVNISSKNKVYSSVDGIVYDKAQTKMIYCPPAKTKITIPDTLTSLDMRIIKSLSNLKELVLGKGITSIADEQFKGFSKLTSITLTDSVTSIGTSAFEDCKSLTSINIPESVTSIGDGAFMNCSSLSSVTVPNAVESIGPYTFYFCSGIEKLSIGSGVKSIGDGAFSHCSKLASIIIGNSVETIGQYAFDGCSSLESLTIPDSVKSIDYGAFISCGKLTEVNIPQSVDVVGGYAFGYLDKSGGSVNGEINSAADSFTNEIQSEKYTKVKGFTILCSKGTAALKYAKENGFNYSVIIPSSRLAGTNRFSTAAAISKASYPDGAETVILAFGLNYADALAGVPLAEKLNAPILLTHTKTLPDETLAEIKRLGAKNVILLGGVGAINENVEKTLTDNKLTVKRLAGKTRFGTATAIANELNKAPEELFFVYGLNSADALSVGGVAAAKGAPIIYLTTDGKLNADTEAYLKTVKGKVKNAYIIGGDGVISNAMMKNVATALGLKSGKTVVRVAGANRYETCVAVNNKFKNVVSSEGICVAKGLDFPDALAGGVYAAKNKQALFLADGKKLQDIQSTYLKGKNASKITVFGGTGAVPDDLVKLIAQASV